MEAVVYTSHTGFTARYAALLGEQTGLPVYRLEQARKTLPQGAAVLYLGWLCAGGIKGLKQARRRFAVRAVCAVGMAPQAETAVLAKANRVTCPLFYAQGGYAPEKLRGVPKAMMWAFTKAMTRKSPETQAQAEMQQALRTGCDCVDREKLAPVLVWLREGGQ